MQVAFTCSILSKDTKVESDYKDNDYIWIKELMRYPQILAQHRRPERCPRSIPRADTRASPVAHVASPRDVRAP